MSKKNLKTMPNALTKYLHARKERVDYVLKKFLANQKYSNNKLYKAINYSLLNGGKRLRPILVYAVGETFNTSLDALDVPAISVELIHCFSLIHDDLPAMDNDDFRRGQPTCHKKFDEAIAILAGDALAMLPFQILTSNLTPNIEAETKLKMIAALTEGSLQMVVGQTLDMEASIVKKNQISVKKLENMYELKTGALLRTSIKLAALASNINNTEHLKNLDGFANALGLAFQIQDDIFDLENPEENHEDKIIYPTLVGIDAAKFRVQELFNDAFASLEKLPYDTSLLQSLANYILQRTF